MGKRNIDNTRWLVTYSDFVTLLLTFFVVFYASTEGISNTDLNAILSPFKSGEGVLKETSVIPATDLAKRYQRAERWERFNEYIKERGLSDQVSIDLLPTGNRIILKESLTFESGAAFLLERSKAVLKEITYLFDESIMEVEVQGHTDNIPIRNAAAKSNWNLGAERAISVLSFLLENTNINPQSFKAASHGEFHPVAPNDDADGRRLNRRVEILIRYKDGKPRVFDPKLNIPT
jgi:chemotaxis protein MotB